MKGEVGSCCHPPLSPSKRWETIKPRPTATERSRAQQTTSGERQRIIAILHQWGIHSLGQFAALEKEEVANRLGPEAARMWERATGKATRVLKLVPPPEVFAESFEFEHDVETIEPLLFILRRFLQQFSLRLGALYLVARDLKLRITFGDKTAYEHFFRIPEPSNNEEVLFRMLHAHLENFTSEAPIVAVALEAQPTQPSRQQFSLFESALRDPTQLSETLARLTGLFGEERVGTPVLQDTHHPDAFQMTPFRWQLPEAIAPAAAPAGPALRRFRSGVAAAVLLDENKPAHLRSAEVQGEVVAEAGPFKASGKWWDRSRWTRTEWDLQLANGTVCRCHAAGARWQVDGLYD